MKPIIFEIFGISIYSYGLMLAISFLVGLFIATRLARKSGINPDVISNLAIWIMIISVVGAKLLYILTNLNDYLTDPSQLLQIRSGGFAFYGGLIPSLIFTYWYLKRKKLPLWKVMDCMAPSTAIGLGITRIGCFLAGCCYGKPTKVPWGVRFPADSYAACHYGPTHHIHPTQLYSSFAGFALFAILMFLWKRRPFDGAVTWSFFLIYSIYRPIIEIFRGDPERGFIFGLSTSQFLSIPLFFLALFMLFTLWKRAEAKGKISKNKK